MPDLNTVDVSTTRARTVGRPESMYPSPFFDLSRTFMPSAIRDTFEWCAYFQQKNPLVSAVTNKLSAYAITDLVYDEDKPTAVTYKKIFEEIVNLRTFLQELNLDRYCFSRETKVILETGVQEIHTLEGQTVSVLSKDGVYRPATFSCFGEQPLYEIILGDGTKLCATAEHKWPVLNNSKKPAESTTINLRSKSLIRNVAPRPEKTAEYYQGVQHGIVYGDGHVYNKPKPGYEGRQPLAAVCLYGPKLQDLAQYFPNKVPSTGYWQGDRGTIYGLPEHYKTTLPAADASASYWYGFVCGFIATDGNVSGRGDTTAAQARPDVMHAIREQLPRIGMLGGQVRPVLSTSVRPGQTEVSSVMMYTLSLTGRLMQPADFLREMHRKNFETAHKKNSSYGKYSRVISVQPTGRVEKVYCCVEPETHTFTIEQGYLTSNCFGNSFASVAFPIIKILICTKCQASEQATVATWKWRGNKFMLECKKCGETTAAKVRDDTAMAESRIRLIRWNPRTITLKYNELTGETRYFWAMPLHTKNELRLGRRETLCETPQAFIDALESGKLIEMKPGSIFHARRAAISRDPIDAMWGAPLILPVLQNVFLLQVLQKSQEVVAMEYVVPFRFLHPDVRTEGGDVYNNVNLTDWMKSIKEQVVQWKRDAGHIAIFPVPVGQQTMGGQGRSLLLHQEIRIYSDMILGGMGVPPGFYYGEANWSGANVNLRALENEFLSNRQDMQHFINFAAHRIADGLNIEYCEHKFKPFKMADDLARAQFKFGLAQNGYLSRSTYMQELDYSFEDESKQIEIEQKVLAQRQQEQALSQAAAQGLAGIANSGYQAVAQSNMQKAQMANQAAMQPQQAAAQPAPPQGQAQAGQPPNTAEGIAQQLGQVPEPQRYQILAKMRSQNPDLYQAVNGILASSQSQGLPNGGQLPEQRAPRAGPGRTQI